MKQILIGFFLGLSLALSITACSMGSKSVKYKDFPIRASEYSAFMQCLDGDLKNACKYECIEYNRKNECKEGREKVARINIENSLAGGWMLISKTFFLKLIQNQK